MMEPPRQVMHKITAAEEYLQHGFVAQIVSKWSTNYVGPDGLDIPNTLHCIILNTQQTQNIQPITVKLCFKKKIYFWEASLCMII